MGAVRRSAALTADITMAACQVRAGEWVEAELKSPMLRRKQHLSCDQGKRKLVPSFTPEAAPF